MNTERNINHVEILENFDSTIEYSRETIRMVTKMMEQSSGEEYLNYKAKREELQGSLDTLLKGRRKVKRDISRLEAEVHAAIDAVELHNNQELSDMPEASKEKQKTAAKPSSRSPAVISDGGEKLEYRDFLRIERKSRSKKRREALDKSIQDFWPEEKRWNLVKGHGWFAVPKHIPVVLSILDDLAPKGIKLGSTYLALMSMTWEGEPVASIKDEAEMAMLAGFAGKNRKYAFRQRLALLAEMNMIRVVGNPGEWQQVFIRDPLDALDELVTAGKLAMESPQVMFLRHYLTHRAL